MHPWHTASLLRIVALFVERACTLALAVLLYRLHQKMAESPHLQFLHDWVKREGVVTIIVVGLLSVAFMLSLAAESLLLSLEPPVLPPATLPSPPPPSTTPLATASSSRRASNPAHGTESNEA